MAVGGVFPGCFLCHSSCGCVQFLCPILMASFEFISFFIGLPEMAIGEVGVEMGLESS